jgi:hypothetical protein
MPNHVWNSIGVSGAIADIEAFVAKAGKPHITEFKGKRYQDETGAWKYDPEIIDTHEDTDPFSFWNFIKPDDEILPVYFGHEKSEKPEGYEGWDFAEKMAHDLKFTGNNAYDWNVRNWGTKWDAYDQTFDGVTTDEAIGKASATYSFNTAWSIPVPVFEALCEQHPELSFSFESEEEQGWGATYESSAVDDPEDGEPTSALLLISEWDIPESHAELVARGRECHCEYDDDEDSWYDDCPREERVFTVVVEQTFVVKATDAEKAWELAEEHLNKPIENLPEGVEQSDEYSLFVKNPETGERLYPTLGGGE